MKYVSYLLLDLTSIYMLKSPHKMEVNELR